MEAALKLGYRMVLEAVRKLTILLPTLFLKKKRNSNSCQHQVGNGVVHRLVLIMCNHLMLRINLGLLAGIDLVSASMGGCV